MGVVSTKALAHLITVKPGPEAFKQFYALLHRRLEQAKLMPKVLRSKSDIFFFEDTACPRFFCTDPMFGASIGADPEIFSRLLRPNYLEWLGDTANYTPHNCDTPAQALTLMLMMQTWGEWAQCYLDEVP